MGQIVRNRISMFKASLRRMRRRMWGVLELTLAIVGTMVMLAEAADEIFSCNMLFEFYRRHFCVLLAAILLIAVVTKWDLLEFSTKVAHAPDVSVVLKVCDALRNKGAVIIPTNTTFDTLMEDDFISEGSLQGQYQTRYFRNSRSELDALIERGLRQKSYDLLHDGRTTKGRRYPIGTLCRVSTSKKRAYLLADSDINERGVPIDVSAQNVSLALSRLWDSLIEEGNREPYSIPLICTGRAGVRDASRDDVVKEIVVSFLAATHRQKFTERLVICIHPADYEKVSWDELCKFIDYKCQLSQERVVAESASGYIQVSNSSKKGQQDG